MLSCRLQCALAALSIVLALGGVTGAPSDPRLRQFLQKSLAAAAGKQVRRLPRRLLSPHPNPLTFPRLAPAPLVNLRCSQSAGAFWGPLATKALGKTFKVQNTFLPFFFSFPISAVGHSSGEFFGIQDNSKTLVN